MCRMRLYRSRVAGATLSRVRLRPRLAGSNQYHRLATARPSNEVDRLDNILFLAVALPVEILWAAFVSPILPRVSDSSVVVSLGWPESKAYQSIAISFRYHLTIYPNLKDGVFAPKSDARPDDLRIDLMCSDGSSRTLLIDPATLHFRDQSAAPAMSLTPLNSNALLAWIKSGGVRSEAVQLKNEMSEVMMPLHRWVGPPSLLYVSTFAGTGRTISSQGFGKEFLIRSQTGNTATKSLLWVDSVPWLIGAIAWRAGMIKIIRSPSPAEGSGSAN